MHSTKGVYIRVCGWSLGAISQDSCFGVIVALHGVEALTRYLLKRAEKLLWYRTVRRLGSRLYDYHGNSRKAQVKSIISNQGWIVGSIVIAEKE
jgi:hypothetical protein